MVLSACIGLVGGAAAAWGIYHRLAPGERVVGQTSGAGGGDTTLPSLAADRAASVVAIATQPISPEGLLSGTPGLADGVVASSDGVVITSARAVSGATRLRVALADGHAYDALIAATDPRHGLVALRAVGAHDLTALPISQRAPRPGDAAILLARPPLGSLGVVPGTVRSTGGRIETGVEGSPSAEDVAALTQVADPGDEGAAVLDERGSLIGVATSGPSTGEAGTRGGLDALPGRAAAELADRAGDRRPPAQATLGLDTVPLDPAAAAAAGLRPGALVRSVVADGPAASAGLVPGDVVLALNGTPVDADHPLDPAAAQLFPGERVTLSILGGDRLGRDRARDVPLTVGSG